MRYYAHTERVPPNLNTYRNSHTLAPAAGGCYLYEYSSLRLETRSWTHTDWCGHLEGQFERRVALWTLVGVIVFFKIYTVVLVMIFDRSAEMFIFMAVMNFPFILGGLAIVAVVGLVWFRLLRGRARRSRLLREEWYVDEEESTDVLPKGQD